MGLILSTTSSSRAQAGPKVILAVIVDDLGWADVGFHRDPPSPEIQTPALDALVADGIELTRHYAHCTCTPSRSSFFSGRLPMHVQQTLSNPEDPTMGVPRNMTVIAAKMRQAGYKTHVVGKWDIGMATPVHTPEGRGFDSSLIYYEHKNDYWTQVGLQSVCENYAPIVDLWDSGAPARTLNGTGFEELLFVDRVLSIIEAHDPTQPLFLVYTPHLTHCPLQVPPAVLARFNFTDDESLCQAQTAYIFPGSTKADFRCRSQYAAMVSLVDEAIGNVTAALRAKGLWNDTLMVLSADNGGPLILDESGANNAPLRGGKYSDWEGGVRVNAFVSGGFVPPSQRGSVQSNIIHMADWYGTFCSLAGVDPEDPVAAAAGLPPVDSMNVWPLLSGANSTAPRFEIPVSNQTLIQGSFKLIEGTMGYAGWTGSAYPNASSSAHDPCDVSMACGSGCIFDVVNDPTEHVNLAPQRPDLVASMSARLAELRKSFFSNNDVGVDTCPPGVTMPCACWRAINYWGGYFGPYQY